LFCLPQYSFGQGDLLGKVTLELYRPLGGAFGSTLFHTFQSLAALIDSFPGQFGDSAQTLYCPGFALFRIHFQ
jgi:hypothetical protein